MCGGEGILRMPILHLPLKIITLRAREYKYYLIYGDRYVERFTTYYFGVRE